jgi:hypothetical protein
MKRKSSKPAPRWRVTRIGGSRGREICTLEADTADAAIKRAFRDGIDDPHRQKPVSRVSRRVNTQARVRNETARASGDVTRAKYEWSPLRL